MKIGLVNPAVICLKGLFQRKKRRAVHLWQYLTPELLDQSLPNLRTTSQIITDKLLKIRIALLQSISECQATNKGE